MMNSFVVSDVDLLTMIAMFGAMVVLLRHDEMCRRLTMSAGAVAVAGSGAGAGAGAGVLALAVAMAGMKS